MHVGRALCWGCVQSRPSSAASRPARPASCVFWQLIVHPTPPLESFTQHGEVRCHSALICVPAAHLVESCVHPHIQPPGLVNNQRADQAPTSEVCHSGGPIGTPLLCSATLLYEMMHYTSGRGSILRSVCGTIVYVLKVLRRHLRVRCLRVCLRSILQLHPRVLAGHPRNQSAVTSICAESKSQGVALPWPSCLPVLFLPAGVVVTKVCLEVAHVCKVVAESARQGVCPTSLTAAVA